MFKAYQEPPKPSYDWTDMLVEKGLPILGGAAGAVIGGLSPAGPAGIAPGMSLGTGLGTTLSGLISNKPTAEAKMAKGIEGAQKGWKDWRELPPEKKLDTDEKGKIPGASSPTAAAPATIAQLAGTGTGGASNISGSSDISGEDDLKYKSMYAPRFARY